MDVPFPQTRYQGSKRKLITNLQGILEKMKFISVLDAFGGTGVVSHLCKRMGKKVVYNDLLLSNWHIGTALIENKGIKYDLDKGEFLSWPDSIRQSYAEQILSGPWPYAGMSAHLEIGSNTSLRWVVCGDVYSF